MFTRPMLRAVPASLALLLGAAAAAAASAATPVSWITDSRVTESSALAISLADPTIAYTLNDDEAHDAAVVYAIKIATGAVVGVTTLAGVDAVDAEALAIDPSGYLWFADTGTDGGRADNWSHEPPTLYRFKEPRTSTATVSATEYPIRYGSSGAHENVEAMLIRAKDGARFLITKGTGTNDGRLYSLPKTLTANQTNTATLKQSNLADSVSDGSFTPNSTWAVVRKAKTKVLVYDTRDTPWKLHYKWDPTFNPLLKKPESLAFRADGKKFLVGSEGAGEYTDPDGRSPLFWSSFSQKTGKPS